MSLRLEVLQPDAAELFKVLSQAPELEGLTLVGGTALALQIAHRVSLDFDFACLDDRLPTLRLDALITRLKQQGLRVQLITQPDQISRFKINTGLNLLESVRDYVINGVKVTFFVLGKTELQRGHYRNAAKLESPDRIFSVMGLEGLKTAKTLVLADRVRSRDLFDLFILHREYGDTIEALLERVTTLGTLDDPEHYKALLRGQIPIDANDEGLEAVDVEVELETIYAYFDQRIADFEIARAKAFFLKL